ncbi:putative AdoMet-dependent rRNA methyltransferase SPB1 [Coniochaeta ligniaria NRRL 30616]|uniref:Putative AdoMet-dependent rRNA methyltransferase SPB1 n=1 Tax=Coniochaeta ligniaria NRRL 30616 TaxID=1408157 RepID=A0A1J7J955_9PEZI|nr:putative AdoMet-dependent rRNA methyltransferase SPB1 [Coniochaeta ligniaria NRRL 30616]
MAIQKKHGKGRLDKWYKLAKEKGYRARAAFKLIQLNKKYGFLEKSKVLLDLCAAPGSWCQVAAETMPVNSLIIGVDLSPIKAIPKVITFQSDITTEKCRATIRGHLKTWKADTVLHDGAPNVGTAWVQDSFNQAELTLQAMRLATDFLIEGGTFVTKVFRSKDYNSLLWVFNQLFTKVEATKPPSSRNVSAEIFVVCRGFKAPKRIDPRLLDPRTVFAELADPAPNNEAKVYNPEIKKRKRGGYEEDEMLQFKELPASEFINTTDPIAILGQYNKLTLDGAANGDVALAALNKLPETTDDIRLCCQDLKVLGRKEFKMLLKWRLRVREIFGFPSKKTAKQSLIEEAEEVATMEPMDEELKIQEELQALKDKESSKKKRERRRANEQKQKEIVRMQLNMTAPMDIGMEEAGPMGEGAMFALKTLDQSSAVKRIAKGKMALIKEDEAKKDHDSGLGSSGETDSESDEEEDRLERELDGMYDQYKTRKGERDAKYRAKRLREEKEDGEWEGVSADEKGVSDDEVLEEDSDDDEEEDEEELAQKALIRDLDAAPAADGLSKRATRFFQQDIFKDVAALLDDDEEAEEDSEEKAEAAQEDEVDVMDVDDEVEDIPAPKAVKQKKQKAPVAEPEDSDDDDFEIVKSDRKDEVEDDDESDWEDEHKRRKDPRPEIDIITAEAMTLAHELATGKKSSHDLIDDGFNKHALKDRDGLPDWFIEDESKHDRPQRPITKAAARAIQEKTRAYNARPIKKVREAKARKKFHAAQRLEKLKKKSDMLANEEGMTEKEKASSISKLMAKASKAKPRKPLRVVVAKGVNRGKSGRPNGVKGRYKMVDPRMRKDMRAMKRTAAKSKKR